MLKRLAILAFALPVFAVAGAAALQAVTGLPFLSVGIEKAVRMFDGHLPGGTIADRARAALSDRLAEAGLREGAETFIRIFKEEAELEVWLADGETYRRLHTYPICKFSGFLGPKLKEGDRQAPEGFYAVSAKQLHPGSNHYRAFNIGFPNAYDRAHGRTGTYLMVHGGCASIGCYAMTDQGIGEIYALTEAALSAGQKTVPVHIFPFRMTEARLSNVPEGEWRDFWRNLQEGHDLFEENRVPPDVGVAGKRYVFDKAEAAVMIAGW